jgi:glycine/D-amino acid oxidase-like deaminating enzyme
MTDDSMQSRIGRQLFSRRKLLFGGLGVGAVSVAGAGFFLGKTDVRILPGRSRARPVESSNGFPKTVDVVVIGGGMVGTVTAFMLAERGIAVALCEKGVIAGEASGRSMGFIYSHYEDADKSELLARSKQLWPGLAARTGVDTSYRPVGIVGPLDSEAERAGAEAWLASMQGKPGFDARIISANELLAICPGMINPAAASLYTPGDGAVEPTLAAPAIADGARNKGAIILQGCAVRGLETSGGQVSGVVTEKGPIACQAVVLAGGAWTPLFARSLGISYDQFDLHMSMAGLTPTPGPQISISCGAYGFRRRPDGGYSFGAIEFAAPLTPATFTHLRQIMPMAAAFKDITHPGLSPTEFWRELRMPARWPLDQPSPFEERRILMPAFRGETIEAALVQLKARLPAFESTRIAERWAGVISATADNMPVISAIPNQPGLYIGSGFTNGMTFGPGAGEALAELATGGKPAIDLSGYRLTRFSDGSDLRFHG